MDINAYSNRISVTVNARDAGVLCPATAEASLFNAEENTWYVNRVFVRPEARGRGLGMKILTRLIDEVVAMGCEKLIVEPGGYGSDPEELKVFYGKAGFRPISSWMEWRTEWCKHA